MSSTLDTVKDRERLKARTAPYWQRLSAGCHLGYRKLTASSTGAWLAQSYDPDTRKQVRRSLGAFDSLPPGQQFDAAKKAAEAWFDHLGKGGSTDVVTVQKACANYVKRAEDDSKADKARDLRLRFARWVDEDKIASVPLTKLTRKHVEAWRKTVTDAPVVINPHGVVKRTRKRSPSSINREMTALRAALNQAHDDGHVTTDQAWRVALRPIQNADGRRDAYLDRAQRAALISKSPADVGTLLTSMSLVPLRPGALAALKVKHFDKRLGVLTVGKDKAGRDRKIKLPPKTAEFFESLAVDKLPEATLIVRADGKNWHRDAWKKPVKAAVIEAGLPGTITAYALRHSAITDLVVGGLDLLTVAQLSGTSVAMIEKHYGHLRADHAAAALALLAL